MAPIMFKHNRSTQTQEQRSLAIKSIANKTDPKTCIQKYSMYSKLASSTGAGTGKVTSCNKVQNVYLNGKPYWS